MGNTVTEILLKRAEEAPDSFLMADEKETLSAGQAVERALFFAEELKKCGMERGKCVLIPCTQDVRFLIARIACGLAGFVFVPLEKGISDEKKERIRKETGAFMEADPSGAFADGTLPADSFEMRAPDPDEVTEILYTTGTTGQAKGIEITYANNMALAENVAFGVEIEAGNVELVPLLLSHSHALRTCYANFIAGGSVVVSEGFTKPLAVYRMIQNCHVTALDLSPSACLVMLRMFRHELKELRERLRYIEIGTAMLPEDTKEKLKTVFPELRLYNFYGSTESGRSCVLNFNTEDDLPGCVGFPTKHTAFKIIGPDGEAIASSPLRTGLVASAGPMNMKGYLGQPALTAEVLKDGFLYTKDEGYFDEKGRLFVLGRADDIINCNGVKILPDDVETAAMKSKLIRDCACVPDPDPVAGQVPKLFVVPAGNYDEELFICELRTLLDKTQEPKKIEIISEIPRSANGKIRRKELVNRSEKG